MTSEKGDISMAERGIATVQGRERESHEEQSGEHMFHHDSASKEYAIRDSVNEVEESWEQVEAMSSECRSDAASESGSSILAISSRVQGGCHALHLSKTSTRIETEVMAYLDRHPTAMKRIQAHTLQHSHTVGSKTAPVGGAIGLPDFGGGKEYPPPLPEREQYVVEFNGVDDPRHAQNFTTKKKLIITTILVWNSLGATFASSVFSAGGGSVSHHFHVNREIVTLGTSLFVLGYAVGPMIFAPLSELYGRRLPTIIGALGFAIFNTAVATSKDYQTLVICRFLAGLFGSCSLSVTGAVLADIFDNKHRGIAIAAFSATLMVGPFCGPMVGGFVEKSHLGWRWTAWLPAFMGYSACVLAMIFLDETYGPVVLVSKAAELRRLTHNWGIHAKQEEVEVDLKELIVKNVSRPLRILFTEPIVLIITLYMSFIYGLLYLNLTAYAIVFGEVYGWTPGVQGLPYLALIVGVMIGFGCVVYVNGDYVKRLEANHDVPVPEWRLPLSMVGGLVFSAGLFWFGWAGHDSSTPWIVPTLAGIFLGFGIYSVFLQCLNYIVDAYLMFAASAIAANTIMRSLFGAAFPMFATYLFEGIGIQWGMTLLGCVSMLFIPIPFLLYKYGKRVRAKSRFAPGFDLRGS